MKRVTRIEEGTKEKGRGKGRWRERKEQENRRATTGQCRAGIHTACCCEQQQFY